MYGRRSRGVVATGESNVILSTLGSIPPDMEMDIEQCAVEMEDIRLGLGMDLGSLSTAVGGDDGEPLSEEELKSPAPSYSAALEMGFRSASAASLDDIRGIRVEIEKTTVTI